MNTRQIPGRDKIGSLAPGKYKTFEGTEISIENCVKAKVKDLVVEGKTIQDTENLSNIESVAERERNLASYIINAIGKLGTKVVFDNKNCLKITSTFSRTIVLDDTSNYQIYVNAYANNENNKAYSIGNFGGTYIGCGSKTWQVFKTTNSLNKFSIYNYQNSEVYIDLDSLSLERVVNPYPLKLKINEENNYINIPIPLRSLPNGVADTIEGNKLVQRVGKVVLDGTENWALRVTSDDYLVYNCGGLNILKTSTDYGRSSQKMICEQFAPSNISSMDSTAITKEGICLRGTGTGFILSISKNKLDTQNLAGFKSYLKSNPVTVTYELYSQIIHDLEIPSISTTKGTNIITTENNIKPKLSMKVKVKK